MKRIEECAREREGGSVRGERWCEGWRDGVKVKRERGIGVRERRCESEKERGAKKE